MKALTIRDPWAHLIALGAKDVENRVGGTNYRGPLAIHVARTFDELALDHPRVRRALALEGAPARDRLDRITAARDHATQLAGHVIAVVDLVDCHEATPGCCPTWGDRQAPNGRTMRHLVLADARPLAEPFEARGLLGLWPIDDARLDAAAGRPT